MRYNRSITFILSAEVFVFLILLTGAASFAAELGEVQTAIWTGGHRWVAGETSVSRLSFEERRMRAGLIKPTHSEGAPVLSTQGTEPPVGLPASLDWRNNGGNFVTPVRNQGGCGSCWAFATTAALESALLRSGVSATGLDKSEQVLVSCGSAGSCAGGYTSYASDYIKNVGLPNESCYPYTGANGTCSAACVNWQSSASRISSWSYVTVTSTTVDALKSGLNSFGPLATTMDVYNDFFYYTSGVYAYSSGSYAGGHAVLLVGYDDPGQYFIVKNSWGSGWGEAGYFRIAYSEVNSVVNFGDWTIAYSPSSTDAIAPSITSFSIPSTASSLTISISSLTATDNVGVAGYVLTESATTPSPTATGWSATAPASYTFASAGTKTLYAWAKDAAGNVSASSSRNVVITLPPPPTVNILWRNSATGQDAVWYMNQQATSGVLLPTLTDLNWKIVGVGDFNTDGKPDLVWRHSVTGQNAVWYMNGTSLTSGVMLPALTDLNWKIVGVGDFNTDGKPDLVWRHSVTGQNAVWYMNGTSLTSGVMLPALTDLNWKIVGVADFNGDGKPDLVWRHSVTGQNAVWYMNGTSLTSGVMLPALTDLNWKIVGVGDFNADGKLDLLWRHSVTGQNAVWYMNGTSLTSGCDAPCPYRPELEYCGDSTIKVCGSV